jgi:hypothetical protein
MHGITVKNTAGHLLISSEFEALHSIGRCSINLDGPPYPSNYLTSFPGYGGSLNGRNWHRYSIGTGDQVPVFFILPRSSSRFFSFLNIFQGPPRYPGQPAVWHLDVLVSGGGTLHNTPIVYAFAPRSSLPEAVPPTYRGPPDYGFFYNNMGLQTKMADGRVAFDSRMHPLAITDTISVTPPMYPCNGGVPAVGGGYYGWNDTTLDFDFNCTNTYTQTALTTTIPRKYLMFSVPSIQQAVYQRTKLGHKTSYTPWYEGGGQQEHYSNATWWCMYRGAFRLRQGILDAGWNQLWAGYHFSSLVTDNFWFSGGDQRMETGTQPYAPKTINLQPSTVMFADARNYMDGMQESYYAVDL